MIKFIKRIPKMLSDEICGQWDCGLVFLALLIPIMILIGILATGIGFGASI